jgi:hypothetical protein
MPLQLTRRHLLAGAAATAACAAIEAVEVTPVEWPTAPLVDRQTFFDGRVDWTFHARRREWVGYDRVVRPRDRSRKSAARRRTSLSAGDGGITYLPLRDRLMRVTTSSQACSSSAG